MTTKRRAPTADEIEAGQALKRVMAAANMEQQELAEALDVTPGAISQWIRAFTRMPFQHAEKAAKILHCDPSEISVAYRDLPASHKHGLMVREPTGPLAGADFAAPPDKITVIEVMFRSLVATLAANAPIAAEAFADHLEKSARKKGISLDFDLVAEVLNIVRSKRATKESAQRRA